MKKNKIVICLILFVSSLNVFANSLSSASPLNADVYFIEPSDGQIVGKNVKVVFGLKNMGVAPAGSNIENTGHHHLLINSDDLTDLSKPLPATDKIKHFGGGQTETEIMLPPGKHTLQLILANFLHVPHDPPVISNKITITVQ